MPRPLFIYEMPEEQKQALLMLARHPLPELRCKAARELALPWATMVELARDEDVQVRLTVAANPCCPMAAVGILADDPSPEVRKLVARTRYLTAPLMFKLVCDSDIEVRKALARNQFVRVMLPEIASLLDKECFGEVAAAFAGIMASEGEEGGKGGEDEQP